MTKTSTYFTSNLCIVQLHSGAMHIISSILVSHSQYQMGATPLSLYTYLSILVSHSQYQMGATPLSLYTYRSILVSHSQYQMGATPMLIYSQVWGRVSAPNIRWERRRCDYTPRYGGGSALPISDGSDSVNCRNYYNK